MTTYSAITNAEIDSDSPLTTGLANKFRDNPLSMAERDSSAVQIVPQNVQVFTASGTFNVPSTVTHVDVIVVGGGQGGSGAGGTSSFGAYCSATGGSGGTGGTGSGGDINLSGGDGQLTATFQQSGTTYYVGARGGGSYFGDGGAGLSSATSGVSTSVGGSTSNYGAGGGAGTSGSSSVKSGAAGGCTIARVDVSAVSGGSITVTVGSGATASGALGASGGGIVIVRY